MVGLVDGLDRAVETDAMVKILGPVESAHHSLAAGSRLQLGDGEPASPHATRWFLQQLLAD